MSKKHEPTLYQVMAEFTKLINNPDDTTLELLADSRAVLASDRTSTSTALKKLGAVCKAKGWKVSQKDIVAHAEAYEIFKGSDFEKNAAERREIASLMGCGSTSFAVDQERRTLSVYEGGEKNPHEVVICNCLPIVECVSVVPGQPARIHITLASRSGDKCIEKRCSMLLSQVTSAKGDLQKVLGDEGVVLSNKKRHLDGVCEFIGHQARAKVQEGVRVFELPGVDADNGLLVGADGVLWNGEFMEPDSRGRILDGTSKKVLAYLPAFDDRLYIAPTLKIENFGSVSAEDIAQYLHERNYWRGPNVALLDANLFTRVCVSPDWCRKMFGHAIAFLYISGASGAGKQDVLREGLYLHFGLSISSDDAASAGRTMAYAFERLARNRMCVEFGEANKGGERTMSLSGNPDFYQAMLSAYDGVSYSNLNANRPMNGFPIFNGATFPSDADEMAKRVDEIEITRRKEHAPEALRKLRETTLRLRGVVLNIQKELLRNPHETRKRFVAEYEQAQLEFRHWPKTDGLDARHLGHAALSLAAGRIVNPSFPIAEYVETALRNRFNKSDVVRKFQKSASFFEISYQVLAMRPTSLAGVMAFFKARKEPTVEERYLCFSIGALISHIKGCLGSRWANPLKPAHIYEDLGISECGGGSSWAAFIPRDRNRRENVPLANMPVLIFELSHPDFPSELIDGLEKLATLCIAQNGESPLVYQFPWGDFQQLVEGGSDVG